MRDRSGTQGKAGAVAGVSRDNSHHTGNSFVVGNDGWLGPEGRQDFVKAESRAGGKSHRGLFCAPRSNAIAQEINTVPELQAPGYEKLACERSIDPQRRER